LTHSCQWTADEHQKKKKKKGEKGEKKTGGVEEFPTWLATAKTRVSGIGRSVVIFRRAGVKKPGTRGSFASIPLPLSLLGVLFFLWKFPSGS
jgi:hypothetical protein